MYSEDHMFCVVGSDNILEGYAYACATESSTNPLFWSRAGPHSIILQANRSLPGQID